VEQRAPAALTVARPDAFEEVPGAHGVQFAALPADQVPGAHSVGPAPESKYPGAQSTPPPAAAPNEAVPLEELVPLIVGLAALAVLVIDWRGDLLLEVVPVELPMRLRVAVAVPEACRRRPCGPNPQPLAVEEEEEVAVAVPARAMLAVAVEEADAVGKGEGGEAAAQPQAMKAANKNMRQSGKEFRGRGTPCHGASTRARRRGSRSSAPRGARPVEPAGAGLWQARSARARREVVCVCGGGVL
jgi:hypothetical protein